MKPKPVSRLGARLRKIRCLLMDVDGVLTDGKLHLGGDGEELKTFDVQDGHGIVLAQRAGLMIGFISGRPSKATTRRAADLGVTIVLQSPANKMEMVEQVKREHGLRDEEIGFIGDELVDLPVLRRAGLAVAVPNATDEARESAHYVTRRRGGDGAVREVIEMILKAQGSWQKSIARYLAMVLGMLLLAAGARAADDATGYIEKFEMPQRDDDGNLQWIITGDKAQFRPDGLMDIVNARAQIYVSNRIDMVFSSPTCRLDQARRRAVTDGPVTIERDNIVVTGVGADWDGAKSSLLIHHNVRVVLRSGPALFSDTGRHP